MRWSKLFVPTLREAPADAEAASHRLLLRAGFVRQLHSGHYSLLPLGVRVHQKVSNIVRARMNQMGGQEFSLPMLHPARLWEKSGRWESMGEEMFRLVDRKGADLGLGMTHEEIFATVAAEIGSYRDLPQQWYQIQTKFRDEPRPKSGLLRVREFAMKDAYSFDLDEDGLDASFDLYHRAYVDIFGDLELPATPVEASSGAMGGSGSIEFMVPSTAGEDDVLFCSSCDYAANVERARSALTPIANRPGPEAPEIFDTPGVRTIDALAQAPGGAAAEHQIKTMVMISDGQIVLCLLRGDHTLNVQKLTDQLGSKLVRPASPEEAQACLGALPGSLGAVGVKHVKIVADLALTNRTAMVTGANIDDKHYRGVSLERDIDVERWLDLREVFDTDPCPKCSAPLVMKRCIEVGHIFKLGRRYAEAMNLVVLDESGTKRTPIMGSYGIGIGRAMATAVEVHHDDAGIRWPVAIAPFEVVVVVVSTRDPGSVTVANALYNDLASAGIDVIIDDRDARAGVKFADAELVGIPLRITVGPKGVAKDMVEITSRADGQTDEVQIESVVETVSARILPLRLSAM